MAKTTQKRCGTKRKAKYVPKKNGAVTAGVPTPETPAPSWASAIPIASPTAAAATPIIPAVAAAPAAPAPATIIITTSAAATIPIPATLAIPVTVTVLATSVAEGTQALNRPP